MRQCEECGLSIEHRGPTARFCGEACQKANYRRSGKRAEVCRRYYQRRIRSVPERYERFLAAGRESYRRHPETSALYAKQWRGENRASVRARNLDQQRGRQAVQRGSRRKDIREYAAIILRDPCVYCGRLSTCLDHIKAITNGGDHSPENMAPTCRSCNARKRHRDVLQFLLAR